ncbi:MAG: M28 family peptidase [Cyclobacteriaceae bacterium]
MKQIMISLLTCTVLVGFGQDKNAQKIAKTISEKDLRTHLSILAADSLEGRDTGESGQKRAAAYIAKYFENIGLEAPVDGQYFQEFPFYKSNWTSIYIRKKEEKLETDRFVYFSKRETVGEEYMNLVWIGSGSIGDIDITDKYVVLSNDKEAAWQDRVEEMLNQKPAGFVVMISDEELQMGLKSFRQFYSRTTTSTSLDQEGERIILVDEDMLSWMYDGRSAAALSKGETAKAIINADLLVDNPGSENVLGYLKGSEKPDELVIITAHYDHIGMNNGEIYNGADDDASGTSAVMEVAEAFTAAAKKDNGPKRSILFMCVSGEEKGLLGSQYYTDESPVFPLSSTVANLNIDMIGRRDEMHNDGDYVYLIGSDKLSQELHDLSESVNNNTLELELDYTYNDDNDPNRFYYRSDHYNFAKNNIPIIFYFNGTHADYHRSTDTIEKIDFELLKKRTQLIFYTAWELANKGERIKLD